MKKGVQSLALQGVLSQMWGLSTAQKPTLLRETHLPLSGRASGTLSGFSWATPYVSST